MSDALNLAAIRREFIAGENLIPYDYHYSDLSIKTQDDALVRVFEVSGLLFETADNDIISAWHQQLCQALLSIGIKSSNASIWHWIMKENDTFDADPTFSQPFSADLLHSYSNQLNKNNFYSTRQFIAVAIKSPFRILKGRIAENRRRDALEEIEEKLNEITSELAELQHGIRPLGLYDHNEHKYSGSLEVLFRVLNGYWQPIPLYDAPIKDFLCATRFLCGKDAFEIRTPDKQIYGAALGFRQYMTPTDPLMFQDILRLSFPMMLVQSYTFEDPNKSKSEVARQQRQMKLSRDSSVTYTQRLDIASEQLKTNNIFFGHHHLSLFTYVHSNGDEDPTTIKRRLTDRVSQAKQILSQTGTIVTREDLALPSAHYAALPCNHEYRPRVARIHSRNFAGFMPLHITPNGSDESWWTTRDGEKQSLMAFRTTSSGLYRFNCHIGELGHSLIIGTSGAGKTVLMGTLLSQFDKYDARCILFDKDHGQEILFRALGGEYHIIEKGVPTGLNPYSLDPTPENLNFLTAFTLRLAYPEGNYTAAQENELSQHLRNWYANNEDFPIELRRLSQLRNGLQDPELKERLKKWTKGGAMGWMFDNVEDKFNIVDHQYVGIDTTDILEDPVGKTPFFMYLTHRVTEALDGRRTVLALDEMWKMLDDPYFISMIKDWLKTLRKKNAMLIGATQDASDVGNSQISSTLLTQCQTRIFYANPMAKEEDYKNFALTNNEFHFIKDANPKSRMLLIKQENGSVVVQFKLTNMDRHLAVLSGRIQNILIARKCIKEAGEDPKAWLPLYYQRYTME